MAVRLTETHDGTPASEPIGSLAAIHRIDGQIKQIQGQKLCDTPAMIDFLLDLRNDLTKLTG